MINDLLTYATYDDSRLTNSIFKVPLLSALFLTYCGVVPAGGAHTSTGINHELLDCCYGHRAEGVCVIAYPDIAGSYRCDSSSQ